MYAVYFFDKIRKMVIGSILSSVSEINAVVVGIRSIGTEQLLSVDIEGDIFEIQEKIANKLFNVLENQKNIDRSINWTALQQIMSNNN